MRSKHAFVGILCLLVSANLRAVKVGDPEYLVTKELGAPPAVLVISPKKKILTYDRGDVTIESGKVTRVNLVSKADYEEAKAREEAERRLNMEKREREIAQKAQEAEIAAKSQAEAERRKQLEEDRFELKFSAANESESGSFKVKSLSIALIYPPRDYSSGLQSIGGGTAGGSIYAERPIGCFIKVGILNNTSEPLDLALASIVFKNGNVNDNLGMNLEPRGAIILPGTVAQFGVNVAFGPPPAGHPKMMSYDNCMISLFSGKNSVPLANALWNAAGAANPDNKSSTETKESAR